MQDTTAKQVALLEVIDPDSKLPVEVIIYKEAGGGMFGIDASYAEQYLDEDPCYVRSIFSDDVRVQLID